MANFYKLNSGGDLGIWFILFRKINFRILMKRQLHAQMAKQLDATSKTCSTAVGISANLVLGTIDDYVLQGKIVPFPAKNLKDVKLMDKITEIRIQEINDLENKKKYFFVYYVKNEKIEIIGKSSIKPQCYRQVATYQ